MGRFVMVGMHIEFGGCRRFLRDVFVRLFLVAFFSLLDLPGNEDVHDAPAAPSCSLHGVLMSLAMRNRLQFFVMVKWCDGRTSVGEEGGKEESSSLEERRGLEI